MSYSGLIGRFVSNPSYVDRIRENSANFALIEIKQSTFRNFESTIAIINSSGRSYVVIVFRENIVENNRAVIVNLSNSAFIDRKNLYSNNSGARLFKLREESDLVLDSSELLDNKSDYGLLDVMLSRIYISNSKFHHNYSRHSSG